MSKFVLFPLLIFFLISCEKEPEETVIPVQAEPDKTSIIEEARKYFEKEVNTPQKENDLRNRNKKIKKRQNLKKLALWDQAYTKEISVGTAVIVPLSFSEEIYTQVTDSITLPVSSLTHLMFYKDGKGKKTTEVVTTIPDEEYLLSGSQEKFSGVILIEDWKGNFIKGYSHKDGVVTGISALNIPENAINARTDAPMPCYFIDYYYCSGNSESFECHYNFTEEVFCTSSYDSPYTGPTTSTSKDYTSPVYSGSPSGSSGGSTGTSSPTNPKNPPMTVQEYLAEQWEEEMCKTSNFNNNPCINNAWAKLEYSDLAYEFIENFNGDVPGAVLCLDVQSNLRNAEGDPLNGTTTLSKDGIIRITINKEAAESRPQIEVVRTLLHELIHAEMRRKVESVGGKLSENNFNGLFDYYSRYLPVKDENGKLRYPDGTPQHNLMAAHYIGLMTDALMQANRTTGNREIYESLAWIGLETTVVWKALSQDERDVIESNQLFVRLNWKKCM